MKALTVGGATQDIFLRPRRTEPLTDPHETSLTPATDLGEKIEIEAPSYTVGGGATNAAIALSQLGWQVILCCSLGQDHAGERVIDLLKQRNIETSLITRHPQEETGKTFIVRDALARERAIFVHRGANSHLDLSIISDALLAGLDLLYITSLNPSAATELAGLAQRAQRLGVKLTLNPGAGQLHQQTTMLLATLAHTHTLILNSAEARRLMTTLAQHSPDFQARFTTSPAACHTQAAPLGEDAHLLTQPVWHDGQCLSMQAFLREMLALGPQFVVVTNGENGVYLATKHELLFHPGIKTPVVDTIGAGDAFGSCFSASIAEGVGVEEAIRRGIANSASVLAYTGAQGGLLSAPAVAALAAKIPPGMTQRISLL